MPGGKRRYWIAAGLLLVLAGGFVLLLLSSGNISILTQTLPDGTVVTIRKLSYGKVHKYIAGNVRQKIAGTILPAKYRARFGINVIAFTNSANSTAIFIETVKTNGALSSTAGAYMWSGIWSNVRMTDDAGNQFFLRPGDVVFPASNVMVQSFVSPLVSHRSRYIQLQVSHSDTTWISSLSHTNTNPAHFALNNPAPFAESRWKPEALPFTKEEDGLKVEFLGLTSRLEALRGVNDLRGPPTQARLHIFESKPSALAGGWHLAGVTVLDEEGNSYSPPDAVVTFDTIEFSGGFSPLETRKFRFTLERIPQVRPEDTVTLTNVTVSDSEPASPVTLALHGFKLQFDELTQNNQFQQLNVRYHISPTPSDFRHHITIKSRDRNGNEIVVLDHDGGYSDGANVGFGSSNPRDVATDRVDVTFTLIKCEKRTVEFLARPSPLATNSAPAR